MQLNNDKLLINLRGIESKLKTNFGNIFFQKEFKVSKIGFWYFIMYVIRYNLDFFYVIVKMPAWKKNHLFSNGSTASSTSTGIFNLKQIKHFLYFLYNNI